MASEAHELGIVAKSAWQKRDHLLFTADEKRESHSGCSQEYTIPSGLTLGELPSTCLFPPLKDSTAFQNSPTGAVERIQLQIPSKKIAFNIEILTRGSKQQISAPLVITREKSGPSCMPVAETGCSLS